MRTNKLFDMNETNDLDRQNWHNVNRQRPCISVVL